MTSSTVQGGEFRSLPIVILGCFTVAVFSSCAKDSPVGGFNAPPSLGPMYTLGGTYSGLVGSLLSVQIPGNFLNTAGEGAVTTPNGTFVLNGTLSSGTHYNLMITRQPTNPSQTCVIGNGVGTMGNSNVMNVTITCTTNPARFVYVVNSGSNDVSAYSVDAASGSLAPIAGSPFSAGSIPDSIAVDPAGRFAYVSNQGDATVSAFTIGRSSGALTAVSGSPFATGRGPTSVAIDPSSSFVYVANGDDASVSAYTIDAATGVLKTASSSPFAIGSSPSYVLVQPLGTHVYAANEADSTISVLSIDGGTGDGTGALTAGGSPFATGVGPRSLAVDSSDRFLYAANATSNTLSAFSGAASGALSAISGSPYPTGSTPTSVAIDPLGRFVYLTNEGSNNLSAYSVDPTTGALTPLPGSPFAAGDRPSFVAIDPTGKFIFVADANSNTLSVYAIDATMGALTPVGGAPLTTGTQPTAIAVSD